MRKPILRTWLLWPSIVLLLGFFLIPSLSIIRASIFDPSFTMSHFSRIVERGVYINVFLRTLETSLIVALLAALIGYPIAYFINLQSTRLQFFLMFLILIPLWMSILIRSYAWMAVLGRDGIINTALLGLGLIDAPAQLLFTSGAVYVAMLQILLPIQIITCYSAMTEIDLDLMRAARILGATPRQAVARVFLPLSFEGTVTGITIVFMLAMGFFITPALVGGRKDQLLGNLIEFQVEHLHWNFASALGVLLLFGTVSAVIMIKFAGKIIMRNLWSM